MTDTALVYDPSSYQLHENPFPYYRRMQDEAPLYRNPDMGFWALTRFDDVLAGLGTGPPSAPPRAPSSNRSKVARRLPT